MAANCRLSDSLTLEPGASHPGAAALEPGASHPGAAVALGPGALHTSAVFCRFMISPPHAPTTIPCKDAEANSSRSLQAIEHAGATHVKH